MDTLESSVDFADNDDTKAYRSRKWILVLMVVFLATVGTFIPPIVSVLFGVSPLVILSGTEFVSLITLIVSAYYGANVFSKRVDSIKLEKVLPNPKGEA